MPKFIAKKQDAFEPGIRRKSLKNLKNPDEFVAGHDFVLSARNLE